ncbi:MAG TPA: GMC oxidoreductase [Vicinamibacterales bacterium]|nr:GMC oxidoreductase [Vicinamibacterales bacterium]
MTPSVTVVGSGASGVHFALTVLKKGGSVRMIDVGREGRRPVLPEATLRGLKDQLPDPAEYFLGSSFDAVLLPGVSDEYYGIPPSKDFVFDHPRGFGHQSAGFSPLFSFARGGLAETWTGGCYPLTRQEIEDFPFDHAALARGYDEVASRIGVTGEADDLARFMPVHGHLQTPLRLDAHSERLMAAYARKKAALNAAGAYFGRTRVATLSQPLGSRQPCDYTGRCLWGCPRESLYTPSQTLRECLTYPNFEYIGGVSVSHAKLGADGAVRALVGRAVETGEEREFPVLRVALAAGALLSARIFLTTLAREQGRRVRLDGLMDNRQVLVPFVNLGMIGRAFSSETYQYHLLGMGLDAESPKDYVHGQITTLKTALTHPLIQRVPLDLAASTRAFRAIHAALGLVNVNFRDTRRPDSFVELARADDQKIRIHYRPDAGERDRIRVALARVKRALRTLSCVVPPGMVHVRPMGASVHYAGMLPMTPDSDARPLTTTPTGESRDIRNLYLVDGVTFPFLPAKNLTFTLMANATRIAEAAF